jgi:hypothetical protein
MLAMRTPKKKVCNFVGGVLSPLLANIYLDAMDKSMASKSLQLSASQRRRRREQGKGHGLSVRYADAWVVLWHGTKAEAQDLQEARHTLLEHLGLTLSEEKTQLTHLTEGGLFLGDQIIRAIGTNGHMVPQVLRPDSAITNNRHQVRGMLAPHPSKDSVKAKSLALNRVTNGWCQSYRGTRYPSAVFNKRRSALFWDMAPWLGRTWARRSSQSMQEDDDPQRHTCRVHTLSMVLPSDHKAKRLLTKTWHNPDTAKDASRREKLLVSDSAWSGHEPRPGRLELREEAIALKGTRGAINGPNGASKGVPLQPSEVHGEHLIARSRCKNPKDADRLGNLQIVCTNGHSAKTQHDRRVLSRRRSKPQVRFSTRGMSATYRKGNAPSCPYPV